MCSYVDRLNWLDIVGCTTTLKRSMFRLADSTGIHETAPVNNGVIGGWTHLHDLDRQRLVTSSRRQLLSTF